MADGQAAAGAVACTASRIAAVTASGWETDSACEAPGTSRTPAASARSAMKRCSATGILRSESLKTNQDGSDFQAGVSDGNPVVRAASVTGRWAAPMTAAVVAGTSAANW